MTELLNNCLLKSNYLFRKQQKYWNLWQLQMPIWSIGTHKKAGHLCRLAAKLYIIRLQILWLTCALCMVPSTEFFFSSSFSNDNLITLNSKPAFSKLDNTMCWINHYLMDTCTLKISGSCILPLNTWGQCGIWNCSVFNLEIGQSGWHVSHMAF